MEGRQDAVNWLDVVIDNFIIDADKVIALGGLPALPAMGVGSRVNPVAEVVKRGRADLFDNGAWVAIHNYTINHPLDYPYDPVNQEGQPVSQEEYDRLGQWAWEGRPREQINEWRQSDKNPGDTLEDDATCFLAFHLMDQMIQQALGHAVPIISTEGGPVVGWKEDRRYPRVDPNTHAEWVVQIAEFMQGTREIHGMPCSDSYFSMCHWLIANYRMGYLAPTWESNSWYTDWWNGDFDLAGELPVVARLKALPDVLPDPVNRAVVAGRVLRADTDAGLPDLTVKLLQADREIKSAVTGPDGAFRIEGLAVGVYDIAIAPWGIVRRGVSAVEEIPGGTLPSVTLRLSGGQNSILTGSVQSAAGAPQANVRVRLARSGVQVGEMVTGADGAFRFEALPLGSYQLDIPGITVAGIALDGWQTKNLRLTAGVAGQYRYGVVQKRLLPEDETAGRRIFYGTVTDASGAPLNGVKLRMAWSGAAPGTDFPTTTTGRDPFKPAGSYEFVHSPGTFNLHVVQGDWPSDLAADLETARVPDREGQAITYEVNFRLQAVGAPAQVDGMVAGGATDALLTLTAADDTVRTTRLAADGGFVFPNLPAGTYRLSLAGIGEIAAGIVLEPGALFKLLFPMRSRLSGHVVDAGAPAPDGLVAVLYAPWGWTRQAPLDPSGNFAIDSLPAGSYRLEVGGMALPDLVLNGENELKLAALDLSQGQRSIVRGRVADGAGRPQADVLMTLRRDGILVAQARTDAAGFYRFVKLPAGSYLLEAVGLGRVAAFLLDGERQGGGGRALAAARSRSILQGRSGMPQAPIPAFESPAGAGAVRARLNRPDRGLPLRNCPAGLCAGAQRREPLLTGIVLDEDALVTRCRAAARSPVGAARPLPAVGPAAGPWAPQAMPSGCCWPWCRNTCAGQPAASAPATAPPAQPARARDRLWATTCRRMSKSRCPGCGLPGQPVVRRQVRLRQAWRNSLSRVNSAGSVRLGQFFGRRNAQARRCLNVPCRPLPARSSTARKPMASRSSRCQSRQAAGTGRLSVHHLTPEENGGNHHIYMDILDPAIGDGSGNPNGGRHPLRVPA